MWTKYIVCFILLISIPLATAPPEQVGADITTGSNESYAQGSANNLTFHGGNLSSVNITRTVSSNNWVGVFGQVTHQKILGTASDTYYDWGTFNSTGGIMVANSSSFSSSSVVAMDATLLARENTHLSMGTNNDNITNTLNGTNTAAIGVGPTIIPVGATRALNTSGGRETSILSADSGATVIYTGPYTQDTAGFAGQLVDYQLMLPVDTATGQRTYYFFSVISN